ncbi:HD-GYP domain-containing protein [Methylomonas sp. EFPC1]|uniref:HD-GYP domain-containing protein n=1 Tax=Methylomonas sp. EFPC1 TaxID=2812647 RepID=UPI001968A267|nr:HD-GYP domain-containing protein [Methylomonas sp. EFPC1]QSB03322.1 HD-GYP domain-containing protein [Methylomonas sp. EFPC1]
MKSIQNASHTQNLLHTLYSMAFLVEARDPYTGGHLWRVSQYSTRLALACGFSKPDAVVAGLGGFLHDLGKVGVPDSILNNPGKLTDAEYAVMKTHPALGAQVLEWHPLAPLAMDVVLSHHERVDGRGYPSGLSGRKIAESARIVGIADAFDAMTSTRPYRRGMSLVAAIEQIEVNLDKQFDLHFGRRFIELAQSGELDGIIGHSDTGIPMRECPMCGPVVVVHKHQNAGDKVFCRVCGNGFALEKQQGKLALKPTMQKGSAADLQALIDHDLLARLLEESLPYLPVGSGNGKSWLRQLRDWL